MNAFSGVVVNIPRGDRRDLDAVLKMPPGRLSRQNP